MKLSQAAKDEKEIAIFPRTKRSDAVFGKDINEFERIKGRITHHLCTPFIKEMEFIDYCSFAKMPGIWLGSCKRKGTTIEKVVKKSRTKIIVYNHKEHLVKNCLRQLLRQEFEKFFGKCSYSMNYYKDLLRIVIPYEDDYLIALNVKPQIIADDFRHFEQDYYRIIAEKMEELKKICVEKLHKIHEEKITIEEIFANFFSDEPKLSELLAKISPKIRYVSIGTIGGIPLARFVNTDDDLFLDVFDEFEYFIEIASGLKMKDKFESLFGQTKFNLTVHENIAVMSMPMGRNFFAMMTLDKKITNTEDSNVEKMLDDEFYFPKPMSQIFDFIKNKLDVVYITTDL